MPSLSTPSTDPLRAARTIAAATGCSERASRAAAAASNESASAPSTTSTATTSRCPSVTVPVLSKATTSTRRAASRASGPLMITPMRAPRPLPAMNAAGVARPRAHGQATISTATAGLMAAPTGPRSSQATRVAAATTTTAGTKTAEIRSASRWIGALRDSASLTSRTTWASVPSAPTRRASTTREPCVLSIPPVTSSPGPTSRGTGSPVTIEVSTAEWPSVTTPSAAMLSPGRTRNRMPTFSCDGGTSLPSASRTVPALSPTRAPMASPARRRARASRWRPSSTTATITAAVSK